MALVLWAATAAAQAPANADLTAGDLLAACTEGTAQRERCTVFLLGIMEDDGEDAAPDGAPAFCLRPGTVLGDVRARFIAWAGAHPDDLDTVAANAVRMALAEAFPCPLIQSG